MAEGINNINTVNHDVKRRAFIKSASVAGFFVALGLVFFKKKFLIPPALANFKRSKKRSRRTYSVKEAGFYLYKQKKKSAIHYFSVHDVYYITSTKNTKLMLAPSLKTIPPEKMDLFYSKLAPIKLADAIQLLESQSAKLLNMVWASGELLQNMGLSSYADYGKYGEYRNFIFAVLRNDAANPKNKLSITSRTKLIEMCIASYRREWQVPKMATAEAAEAAIKKNKAEIIQFSNSVYRQFGGINEIFGAEKKI